MSYEDFDLGEQPMAPLEAAVQGYLAAERALGVELRALEDRWMAVTTDSERARMKVELANNRDLQWALINIRGAVHEYAE